MFTKDSHVENDLEFRMFPPHCIVGTPEHELVEELRAFEPDAAAVIQKHRYSAFFETELEQVLKDLRPTRCTSSGSARTSACSTPPPISATATSTSSSARMACETFDAPGHDHREINRWALGHIENILGARVV